MQVLPNKTTVSTDTGYIDLQPGWQLRVVSPILKSGGYRLQTSDQESDSPTIALSTGTDFLGYEVAHYAVRARNRGGVRIEFTSAEITKNGKTVPQSRPILALFQLPRSARYVRLIFLVRVSDADHNMAVLAAKEIDTLNSLTYAVQANPAVACKNGNGSFCSWIPEGIAVRPEIPE